MRADIRHIIMNRMKKGYGDREDFSDMARTRRDMRDMEDFEDERRGVRGSGRRRMDREDGHYIDDEEDFDKPLKLSRKERAKWKRNLVNKDGTRGPHFDDEELYKVIDKMKLSFDNYTEADVCLMANVLYSDFCKAYKRFIPVDEEIYAYVAAAQAFLEDDDGLDGSEKVTAYYYCIANG